MGPERGIHLVINVEVTSQTSLDSLLKLVSTSMSKRLYCSEESCIDRPFFSFGGRARHSPNDVVRLLPKAYLQENYAEG